MPHNQCSTSLFVCLLFFFSFFGPFVHPQLSWAIHWLCYKSSIHLSSLSTLRHWRYFFVFQAKRHVLVCICNSTQSEVQSANQMKPITVESVHCRVSSSIIGASWRRKETFPGMLPRNDIMTFDFFLLFKWRMKQTNTQDRENIIKYLMIPWVFFETAFLQ